jgi:hypothetical protein
MGLRCKPSNPIPHKGVGFFLEAAASAEGNGLKKKMDTTKKAKT